MRIQHLHDLVEPLVRSMGLTLWGIEVAPAAKGKTLRIFIDSDQGISVSQCSSLSRQLSLIFDVEDPFPGGSYTLEISSPGLDRPFFEPGQLEGYQGCSLVLKLKTPVANSKKWQGKLREVRGQTLTLLVGDQEMDVQWDQISRVHLLFEEPPKGQKTGK